MSGGKHRRRFSGPELRAAARRGWDAYSAEYQAEHGGFLGEARFVWCPEGLDEAGAHLLGDVRGLDVLEVGCGAAQCSRWLRAHGAAAVGVDVSREQLRHSHVLDDRTATRVPVVQADAVELPLPDERFDAAFSAFGAVQFAPDLQGLLREVARILRPGGRWVFSVTHPMRWCFPDDPGPEGLVASLPYWNRSPYVELDGAGSPSYVEHHRTMGDYVRALSEAGLQVGEIVEPEWPDELSHEWGGWSAQRGQVIPGTAIFRCRRQE